MWTIRGLLKWKRKHNLRDFNSIVRNGVTPTFGPEFQKLIRNQCSNPMPTEKRDVLPSVVELATEPDA